MAKQIKLNSIPYENGKDLPTEFKIFNMGDNPARHMDTGDSVIKYDNVSGAMVMAQFQDSGMDKLPMDYEHQTPNSAVNGQPAPAAGWFVPEHREDDGLYATNVTWTDNAAEMIAAKEYRFFSPWIGVDEEGRVCELMNVALTNLPAMKNLKPLVKATKVTMTQLLSKLNAEDETKAEQIADELIQFRDAVLQLTQKENAKEALGVLHALKEQNAQIAELTAKLKALTEKQEQDEINGLIDAAVKDGKVPPARKEEVLSLYSKIGKEGIVSYLSMLSIVPSQVPVSKPANDREVIALTGVELEIAKRFGFKPEEFAATKAKIKANKTDIKENE